MAKEKAVRPLAGDVGTHNRIEADDGHYWVRLWSRQAIRREGEAMGNCLRWGDYDGFAGSEDPLERGLWSLRSPGGVSIGLAEVAKTESEHTVREFLGIGNSPASKLAYRQLRHLNAAFVTLGSRLAYDGVRNDPVVVGPNGMTYRWDRAPEGFRLPDHDDRMERRRSASERRAAHQARIYGGIDLPVGDPPAGGEPDVIYYEASQARAARRDPDGWFRTRYGPGGPTLIPWSEEPVSALIALPPRPLPDPGYVERLAHALGIPKEQNVELVAECIQALEGDRPSSQAAQPLVRVDPEGSRIELFASRDQSGREPGITWSNPVQFRPISLTQELRTMAAAAEAGLVDRDAWEHAALNISYENLARAYRNDPQVRARLQGLVRRPRRF